MKLALLVAYDGTDFSGFARQKSARTVQGELEERLSKMLRREILTTGAGRTDAGVHAGGQVMSFEAPEGTDPAWVAMRLNKWVAPEIAIKDSAAVPHDFDARFSARRREYEYRTYRSHAPDPFRDRFMLHLPNEVKVTPMRRAARSFIGEHDFSSFCRKGQGQLVRRVRSLTVVPEGDLLTIKVAADAFCHQMVRSIVGLLLEIGAGRRGPEDAAKALKARDRAAAGPVAPPRGLHLVRVAYRPDPFLQGRRGSVSVDPSPGRG